LGGEEMPKIEFGSCVTRVRELPNKREVSTECDIMLHGIKVAEARWSKFVDKKTGVASPVGLWFTFFTKGKVQDDAYGVLKETQTPRTVTVEVKNHIGKLVEVL